MATAQEQTIQLFCSKCQIETPHAGSVDLNGELVFTCLNELGTTLDGNGAQVPVYCDRFIKLPAGMTEEEINAFFAKYKADSEGQVDISKSEDALASIMASKANATTDNNAEVVNNEQAGVPVATPEGVTV